MVADHGDHAATQLLTSRDAVKQDTKPNKSNFETVSTLGVTPGNSAKHCDTSCR
jgi:hypothetical protein